MNIIIFNQINNDVFRILMEIESEREKEKAESEEKCE